MGFHGDQLNSTLGISTMVSFYGIVGLLVWFLGPSLGLGDETDRIIVIGLVLLTWPIAIMIAAVRKKRAERLAAEEEGADATAAASKSQSRAPAPTRRYDELTRSTEETVQWLRSTKLGAARSGDAVYSLPWFVVAGPTASGKTSLLLSSNLDFHVVRGQRSADQNLVRPTRDLEWRVTDWAVLIDTAGRYQTEGPDADEWAALIEACKKYRKTRPLDGFLIVVDAARVLNCSEAEIEQQAKVLRMRLNEVIQRTKLRFPVYLVFTRLETVAGFEDFFAPMDKGERGQVWGATIPLDQADNAHALFDVEFDYLYDALMRRRLFRLSNAASSQEQLNVFDFPLFFSETRRKLGLFTSALFRRNPFSESPLMRGFYFTSSPPDHAQPGRGRMAVETNDPALGNPQEAGDGYFTESLFRDVLLRDKDLAASFQDGQKRPERLRNLVLGASAVALLLLAIWMFTSYARATTLTREAQTLAGGVMKYAESGKDAAKDDAGLTTVELTAIEALRKKLDEIDDYNRSFGAWIFSVNSVKPYARAIYFDAINHRFFKPAVTALEADLQAADAKPATADGASAAAAPPPNTDLGPYYDRLKTYLMLANQNVEPTFLYAQLESYWKKSSPPDPEWQQIAMLQLDYYCKRFDAEQAPRIKPDEKMVDQARLRLKFYPVVERVYKTILDGIDRKVEPVTLQPLLGTRGLSVLSVSAKVRGSFTLQGYREFKNKLSSAQDELKKDDWVLGPYSAETRGQSADTAKLQDMYFRDYVEQWRNFLNGVNVKEFKGPKDAAETLKVLSATDSPLVLVTKEVAKQTKLSSASGSVFAWIGSWFSSSKDKTGGNLVETQFGPLISFAADEGATSSLSTYRSKLEEIAKKIGNSDSPDQLKQNLKGLPELQQALFATLEPLKNPQASGDAATLLRKPLARLDELVSGTNYEEIKQNWAAKIYPKAQPLEASFPFNDAGQDCPPDNLVQFLNPANGLLSEYFKNNLAANFEEDQWKIKENSSLKARFSPEFQKYLTAAYQLRSALFQAGGQQMEVSYDVTLQPVQGVDIALAIDGQSVRVPGAGSATFKWPVISGASGASITVYKGSDQQVLNEPDRWGVFKLFSKGGMSSAKGDGPYQLTWTVGGVQVRAIVKPGRSPNPFQLDLFKLRAPQSTGE